MALTPHVKDRMAAFTLTTGTGEYTTETAQPPSFQHPNSVMATTDYAVFVVTWAVPTSGSEYEIGLYTKSADHTWARTIILESSNSDNAVSWGAGTKIMTQVVPAESMELLNQREETVASVAGTTDIGAIDSGNIIISGTNTPTTFGTVKNRLKRVRHTGALTINQTATLLTPGGEAIVTIDGTTYWAASDNTATPIWRIFDVWPLSATLTRRGHAELATDAEAIAKADTARVLTPSNLAALGSSATFAGLVEMATDAEAITGTDTARAITAANLAAKYNGIATLSQTTLADDTATSMTIPGGNPAGLALINCSSTASPSPRGAWWCRATNPAVTPVVIAQIADANINLGTGALTGTDPTDTDINIHTHTDGKLYIQNRSGGAKTINVTITAGC